MARPKKVAVSGVEQAAPAVVVDVDVEQVQDRERLIGWLRAAFDERQTEGERRMLRRVVDDWLRGEGYAPLG